MSFTPGPWMARDEYIYTKDKTIVIDGHDTGMLIRIGSADIGNRMSVDMALANARIMAAAPEMKDLLWDAWQDLNALSQGDQTYDACYEATKTMEKIMSLLRRIEGEDA